MWQKGRILVEGTVYEYEAKVYDTGSEFGINGGRVSKCWIHKADSRATLYNYDRGEDVPPANEEVETVLNIILAKYS